MIDEQRSWEISWYSKEDVPDLLAANHEEYGKSDLTQASYFDWAVEKKPGSPPISPVARDKDTGRVIGWALFVPFTILWQGEEEKALLGFNLMVRKEYRRQGISTELIQTGLAEGQKQGYLFMAALANSKSTSVHRKMGDLIGPVIPMVIRPMDIASLTKAFIQNSLMQWAVRSAWRIGGSTIFRESHPNNRKLAMSVNEVDEIGAEFDTFWEKVKGKYKINLVRDRTFLNWRFCEMPERSYRILTARKNDEILGYIILRIAEVRGVHCGLISDFLVEPGREGENAGLLLMNAATQLFREAQAQLGGGLMLPHTQEYRIMCKAGYVRSPDAFAPQSITLVTHPLNDEIPIRDIQQSVSWFITNADHDAV